MATELPPVGVCTKCGDVIYDGVRINGDCSKQPGGKRCKGTYESPIGNDDWAKSSLAMVLAEPRTVGAARPVGYGLDFCPLSSP